MRCAFLALAAIALASCSPKAPEPAATPMAAPATTAAPAPTDANPFLGRWAYASSVTAPWLENGEQEPTPESSIIAAPIVFAEASSSGPDFIACDKPAYSVRKLGSDALFEGNLANPADQAPRLGFTSDDVTTMNFQCASRTGGDGSFEFAMSDPDTILLGLSNVIYTFKRVRP